MHRDIKANKSPLYVLEAELFELQQRTKHNKDTRNRMKRLTEVITTKRYAALKVNEMVDKELEKQESVWYMVSTFVFNFCTSYIITVYGFFGLVRL